METKQFEKRKKLIYELICDKIYVPMKLKEMAILLSVPKSSRGELEEVLNALIAEGKVEVSKKGKYFKSKGHFITGIFIGHPRGFGFVEPEDGGEDIYIPADQVNGAFHQDTVQAAVMTGTSETPGRTDCKDSVPWEAADCRNL